jgi:hypothetical protein
MIRPSALSAALLLAALSLAAAPLAAQDRDTAAAHTHDGAHVHAAAPADTAFAHLQERGRSAMGVDQYTSRHLFESLSDGGRIELQRVEADSAGTATIRAHLQEIARAFRAGDFGTPAFVHLREVPGAAAMAAHRAAITYTYRDLPRGGELRMRTDDIKARVAIHEFMAFQRSEHRTDPSTGP